MNTLYRIMEHSCKGIIEMAVLLTDTDTLVHGFYFIYYHYLTMSVFILSKMFAYEEVTIMFRVC